MPQDEPPTKCRRVEAECAAAVASGALHSAASEGNLSEIETLIRGGGDVNATEEESVTALHCAAHFGHVAVAEFLIAHGAGIDARDEYGCSPLHLAIYAKHNELNDTGATPLYAAARRPDVETAKVFIRHGGSLS